MDKYTKERLAFMLKLDAKCYYRYVHPPWDNVKIDGNIEMQYLFTTIVSNDLVPYGYLKRKLVVLPITIRNGTVELIPIANRYLMKSGISNH